jgi:hypothetical protein
MSKKKKAVLIAGLVISLLICGCCLSVYALTSIGILPNIFPFGRFVATNSNDYDWVDQSDKTRFGYISWSIITSSRLSALDSSFYTENFSKDYNFEAYNGYDYENNYSTKYLRREGGIGGVYYWIENTNTGELINNHVILINKLAPINTAEKAVSMASLETSGLYLLSDIPVGYYSKVEGGYLVLLTKTNVFGCGPHVNSGIIIFVSSTGELKTVATEKVSNLGPDLLGMCVD